MVLGKREDKMAAHESVRQRLKTIKIAFLIMGINLCHRMKLSIASGSDRLNLLSWHIFTLIASLNNGLEDKAYLQILSNQIGRIWKLPKSHSSQWLLIYAIGWNYLLYLGQIILNYLYNTSIASQTIIYKTKHACKHVAEVGKFTSSSASRQTQYMIVQV